MRRSKQAAVSYFWQQLEDYSDECDVTDWTPTTPEDLVRTIELLLQRLKKDLERTP